MRFVIVGPGALGCLMAAKFAAAVAKTEDDLWILDHDRGRAGFIKHQGILYEKNLEQKRYPINACIDPGMIGSADVLFLCVKSYDLQPALELCRPLLISGTLAIFMQNGIAHLDLRDQVGASDAVFGCTSEGATYLGAGHIRHAGDGTTYLGFLKTPGRPAEELLAQTMVRIQVGGLLGSVSDSILSRLWAKLFINVGINALSAIHDCRNGDLLSLPDARSEMEAAVGEASLLAEAKGIIVENDPYQVTVDVCRATAANISSMRQDVLKRRRTEIDAINGAVVREAAKLGMPTPVNDSLVRRIKEIERGYEKQGAKDGSQETDGRS